MKLASIPRNGQKWLDEATGWLSRGVDQWLQALIDVVSASAQGQGKLVQSSAYTSIAATAIPTQGLTAGLYRVSYDVSLLTPASVSSSLTVTLGWTYNGSARSQTFAALTSNVASSQQGGVYAMQIDSATSVTCAVALAYVGTVPSYSFAASLEAL